MELRATVQNNLKVLAARLRAIVTLVLRGKKTQAWHALIALAEKIDHQEVLAARLRAIATLVLKGKKTEAWHALTALADKIDPDTK